MDLTANPRVSGNNNDLAEDCQTLVAIQNSWASQADNSDLMATHPLRTWGVGTATQKKISNWNGVTVSNKRVTMLDFSMFQAANPTALPTVLYIDGSIPTEIANLTSLTNLNLNTNKLSGNIPTQLSSLTNLTSLNLSANELSGNIPTQLGSLTNLTSLHLDYNQLTGDIPTELGNLTSLSQLSLNNNQLTGDIPAEIGSLTSLTNLDLSSNQLTGDIPTEIGSLTRLTYLLLNNNQLTGDIPTEIAISTLNQLSLNSNQLTGNLPTQLGDLVAIRNLYLDNNKFTGSLPTGLGSLVWLANLSFCNNYLTGAVPTGLRSGVTLIDYPTAQGYNPVKCQVASNITFKAPSGLIVALNRNITIDASSYVSDGLYTISCADAKDKSGNLEIIRTGCSFRVFALSFTGESSFTIPYTSTGGDTHDGEISITVGPISRIVFTRPTNLFAELESTKTFDVSSYATDGNYTITCGATLATSRVTIISRNGCSYTISTGSTRGIAGFTVPYYSSGGDTHLGLIDLNVGKIVYTAPSSLSVVAGGTLAVSAGGYATDGSYTISCADATSISTKFTSVTRTADTCNYSVVAKASAATGSASFTIPYTSSSGETLNAVVTVTVSNIAYTAPTLSMAAGETLTVSAGGYASDGSFTISCADATGVSSEFTSVTRTANTCNYSVVAKATASSGSASFTVPYTSSGGDTHNGVVSITIGTISYTAPTGLKVVAGSTLDINASDYATHSGYTISCGAAKNLHTKLSSVSRADATNSPCEYTITPKASATAGSAAFTIPYTSSSGATLDALVTVTISNISYTAPTLSMAAGETLAVSAGGYATDGSYTITCADATGVSSEFTSVTRTANSCNYSVVAKASASSGSASFTVPYTSSGGDTHNGVVSITITPISYTAPTGLKVVAGSTLDINASGYATHSGYTISCGTAKNLHTKLSSVSRADAATKPCEYTITPKTTATAGSATFIIPYTSSSGATLDALVTVTISNIAYTAPIYLSMTAGETLAVSAGGYASDGSFTISCSDATDISSEFTSVTRTPNTCNYSVIAKPTASIGAATFTVPYTSSGGDTHNGVVSITISVISYTAPSDLKVVAGSTLEIDASDYATHLGHTISCGAAKDIHTKLSSVTQVALGTKVGDDNPPGIPTANSCEYTITAEASATAGPATFTVPYSSSSGAALDAQATVTVSNIAYTAPTNLSMTAGETLAVSAGSYASDGSFTISCADATGISSEFTSVTRTANTCNYSVVAKATASVGSASFTVPYTSAGGDTHNGIISITISTISYTAPTGLKIVAGSTLDINASGYATHNGYTISCGVAKSIHTKLSSVSRADAATKPCEYTITAKASATAGDTTFTIPYSSTSGATLDVVITVTVSNIAYTAPTDLYITPGETMEVSAGDYATDGSFTISCADATGVSSEFTSVTRTANTCNYSVVAKATASSGSASFTVPYTSAGGDTHDGIISITISVISYTAPTGLKVAAGSTLDINASGYATHSSYTITCGAAKNLHTKLSSVSRADAANSPCEYTITPKTTATAGTATFTIPYTSSSGATLDAEVTVTISNIAYTAPTLSMAAGETLAVSAGGYATDGTFTITCADATSVSSEFTSVTRTANTCNYSVVAKTTASAGAATFTVPYTSSGGDTHNGIISITITAISYTAPTGLKVVAGSTLDINASGYATHSGYTISCGAAKNLHTKLSSVSRADATNSPCEYTITPKTSATAGTATFTIPYTSSSGATLDAEVTVTISNIAYTAPTLSMAAGETLAVSAGSYATDGTFTITCADATSISTEFTSVTRTANTCNYSVVAKTTASAGAATFTVPYTSSGGDTHNGIISITITAISYTAPTGLKVVAGSTLDINASGYATHSSYTISCGAAKDLHAKLSSVSRADATNSPCEYTITPKASATAGAATFTIPYTSSSGATLDAEVTVTISNIAYTAPTLSMAAGETLAVSAGSYATDGTFTITCADATSISTEFTSVTRTANTCNYSVVAKTTASAGAATFTVPYTSSGGDTHNGIISITITAISYTAPTGLKVVAGSTLDINASGYATHSSYTISCGAAKDLHAKLSSVSRADATNSPCEYTITPKASATAGAATFTIPYTSSSGATLDAEVTVTISNIAYTAPTLSMAAGETLAVSAGGYATDGSFTISCSDATGVSTEFASVTRTANTCNYSVVAKATASSGSATFTVPYTSSGGDTHNGTISITITAINYNAPTGLKVAAGSTLDINASGYATHTSYTITCGAAKSLHTKLSSVSRADATNSPCEYTITPKTSATAGNATFTITYTSSSGATLDAEVTVTISNIAYSPPSGLSVAAGETLAVSAGGYATDGSFTITCADATSVSTEFTSVTRTANTCNYSVVSKATATAGAATFTITYTSSGGDTHNGIISITITAISYTAPTGLKVVASSTLDINALGYATHTGYTITCGTAKSLHTKLSSVSRADATDSPCEYTITPKTTATAGDTTFTIPYTSSSGATLDAEITVTISNIAYEAPTNLSMAAGETLAVSASGYATDGSFTITCADATGVSSEFTSVTRTANTCNYSVVSKATASAGAATFTVPYTSSGGDTHNGIISITITAISFTAPTGLKVVAGSTLDINASGYATHTSYTITCGTAKSLHTKLSSVSRADATNSPCEYNITPKTSATAGDATFTIPYTSSSGATLDAEITVTISNIAYTAPTLSMAAGETLAVSASGYATDGSFTISCADATAVSSEFTSVIRTANTCNYSVVAKTNASSGAATFTVPYTSSGGDTHNGIISITITAITYTAPTGLKVVAGSTLDINATGYATHPSYTITCGTAKSLHTKLSSVSRADATNSPCEYTITPKTTATAGNATFTIPYTSSSGATLDAEVTVTISNIAYTAPTLSMAAGETLAVTAGGYATDGSFTITCADATSVSTEFTSVTRTANTCNYSVVAKATASAGAATFTVPYTSSGGDTHNGIISITITAISYTAPTGLKVVAGSTLDINASGYATHPSYTITCGTAKSLHTKLSSVSRADATNSPCEYTITPKTTATAGDATFTIPYTSSSGATLDAQITVTISNIAYTAPTLSMAAGETLAVTAGGYATDGSFTITCADATNVSTEFTSVTRTANTCNYSVVAKTTAAAGTATFTVPYTSSGGDTHNGIITITISTISYTAPTGLKVVAGSTLDINASGYATHTGYTISCGTAKDLHTKLTSVTRADATNSPCEYTITPKTSATAGDATFTIPYTSSSGATLDAEVTVTISNIAYTAPTLSMAAGETLAVSAGGYATDGTFTISCSDATSVSTEFTSVTRTANTCNYSVVAKATASAGAATFTIPYTSSGGDTHNGIISITITTISYTAPTGLKVVAGSTLDINASGYATHTGYTITCGTAKSLHTKLSSVSRADATNSPCEYTITPKTTATAGDATFTIPYTSSSGATLDAEITVTVSNIAYTAPTLSMAAGETLAVTAGGYATDGTFTISCADATSVSSEFTSVTRTANTCNYSVVAKATATAGSESFTVPYTSSGGDTHNGVISITITAISYTAPTGLKVVAGSTLDINASGYATHSSYTITCGAAKSLHTKLSSVSRADATNSPCEYTITPKTTATAGDTTFTIPYTSSSGATLDAEVTVTISNIAYAAPTLSMAAGETLAISAGGYATDGSFTITCADATSVSTEFTSVTRTANTCNYSVVAKTTATAGTATFTVPYTSTGGDTHNGIISITTTAISYTAPTGLKVTAGSTLDINASGYATHTGYTITCGTAKNLHTKLTSVTRADATNSPCEYTITPKTTATAGDATFTIPYTSSSGATLDAQVTVTISNIAYAAPTLSMAAGATLAVTAGGYATDGSFTITCADATSVSTEFTSVTRTANTCNYSAVAKATASSGAATFTVPYTSSGGDTHNGVISITITAISYTAPTGLKVVAGSTLDINASGYATHSGYTISCGVAKSLHTKLSSVSRADATNSPCEYTITPKTTATAGDATFTIPYTSSSGATLDAEITVTVSNIAYTAPTLSMAAGETLAVSAGGYATDGSFTISCADATAVSSKFTSVTRTANTCNYSVVAKTTATAGTATFTIPYTSSGGDTHNGIISITTTAISYTAPTGLKVVAGSTLDINASGYATHTGYTISCGAAKNLHTKLSSVSRADATNSPCEYTITPKASATAGDATFTIPYTSSSGATLDAEVTVTISNIAYTAPTLSMAAGETLAISAGGYATDGTFTITCADATNVSTEFTSVTRTANTCNYSVVSKATASAGAATFTVPYTSSGGDTHNGIISITITAISYTAPTGLKVVAGSTLDINASGYATHTGYTITCGTAKSLHTKLSSVSRADATNSPCEYTITPKASATAGDATFTIPYTSSSGATLDAEVTVTISNIAYTAPTNLSMAAGETLAVSASGYATDGTFTISCSDATSVSTEFTSVTRTTNTCNYSVVSKATATAGTATFTVPYTSSGGDTHNGTISITITAISYTAPTGLKVVAGSTLDINASGYATHTGYTITCDTTKNLHTKLSSVSRADATNSPCEYTITPKTTATAGNATFTIPYTSSSGATLDAQITVTISNIAYTAPTLSMAAGETLAVSAGTYATDGSFTITCSDATSISTEFTSVTRTANTCNYSAIAKATATAGTATFTIPYTSSGGDTHNGIISITITAISYTAPTGLKVVAGSTLDINASGYATHTGYTITCGTAKNLHTKLSSVSRADATNSPCEYTITPKTTATTGDATFTIPYTSSSGATLDAEITVTISNIAYTAPSSLSMAAGETLAVSAGGYATDGSFTITCADATSVSTEFTSVTRTANTCNYSVVAKATASAGTATFTVPYTSSGGDTHNGIISITITTITYTAPTGLKVVAGSTLDINASGYATHSGYTISCGVAKSLHTKLSSVSRADATNSPCEYTITPKTTTTAGTATFTIPYTSSSGATLDAEITVTISNIAYTAPTLSMAAGETLAISAGSYATDGSFTISCADATSVSTEFTSVTRTANTCNYSVVAKATASSSSASFTVPYTSSGGDTHNGIISITITAISYTAPTGLKVVAGSSLDINASGYVTHTGYTISCGTAKSLHTKLSSVSRADATNSPCEYTITPKTTATAGDATFTIPYTSSSGATLDAQVTVTISNIAYTAPTLSMAAGATLAVSAGSYATDGTFTISCSDATSVSTEFTSVTRTANTCNYSVVAKATASTGAATFTIPYTSTGGDTHNGIISITITAISYTAPTGLKVVAGSTLDINASGYATHSGYTISCGAAKNLHTKLSSVSRADATNSPCEYTITPKTSATAGDATFTIPYTSSSGATLDAEITVTISNIAYAAPTGLSMVAGETLAVSAGGYATDGSFIITCADATSISTEFISVTRTANTCNYSVVAKADASAGTETFTVPYTSTGGDTHNGIIIITVSETINESPPLIPPPEPDPNPEPNPDQDYSPPTSPPISPPSETQPPTDTFQPWNFFSVLPGGANQGEIRKAFNLIPSQYIYSWSQNRQIWIRHPRTNSSLTLPEDMTIAFRSATELDSDTLEAINLGHTASTFLLPLWSILSSPENIRRPDTTSNPPDTSRPVSMDSTDFVFSYGLVDCKADEIVFVIARYDRQREVWAIWLPCHPEKEAHYTEGSDAIYERLTFISKYDPIYVCLISLKSKHISWNSESHIYQTLYDNYSVAYDNHNQDMEFSMNPNCLYRN